MEWSTAVYIFDSVYVGYIPINGSNTKMAMDFFP